MEKQRICAICNRTFANGKAMGGHMRSHFAKLPVPTKLNQTQISSSDSQTPSSTPLKSTSSSSFSVSESPREPAPTRSKRRRRRIAKAESPPQSESASSVSDALSLGEVAMSLVMLSMDKWSTKEMDKEMKTEVENLTEDEFDESSDYEDESAWASGVKTQNYRCETCDKTFKSYQALGGHRANHQKNKKIRQNAAAADDDNDEEERKSVSRSFECPFCDKVFDSGQALGGHKKVHFAYLGIGESKRCTKSDNNLLDLNSPASKEEDEGIRQLKLSSLSNAGISSPSCKFRSRLNQR